MSKIRHSSFIDLVPPRQDGRLAFDEKLNKEKVVTLNDVAQHQVMIPVFLDGKIEYLPWANTQGVRKFNSIKEARDAMEFILPECPFVKEIR